MKKINFEKLPCWVDIRKQGKIELDVKYDFANSMYMRGQGIEMGALAMKIYNSNGEQEYNDRECAIILDFANHINPMLGDSLNDIINSRNEDN